MAAPPLSTTPAAATPGPPGWYARWAEPHYARMAPAQAEQARRIDAWLYSRRGLGAWLGLLCAYVASLLGLRASGFPWAVALLCATVLWVSLPVAAIGAWMFPERFSGRRLLVGALKGVLSGYLGALLGFLLARAVRAGGLPPGDWPAELWLAAQRATPFLLLALLAITLLLWGVSQLRQAQARRELQALQAARAHEAVLRRASEARLQLLQAQIQPHFIFNTLAALQHWVDAGDPRAGPLLRTLTAFLRGSTELLGAGPVRLDAEAQTVAQYLQIMQARLGQRLQFDIDIAPDCAELPLPPGLLLTLVENAIEHGITPALSGGRVTVTARRQGPAVVLQVRDNGAGLAAEARDGMGLANCRERLRHHGDGSGTLSLRALQPGCEATLSIPVPQTASETR